MKQEMMGWQWHQLDHMQIICTLLQTDKCASTSPLSLTSNQQSQSTEGNRQCWIYGRFTKMEIHGRQLIWLNIRCHIVWFFHWVIRSLFPHFPILRFHVLHFPAETFGSSEFGLEFCTRDVRSFFRSCIFCIPSYTATVNMMIADDLYVITTSVLRYHS